MDLFTSYGHGFFFFFGAGNIEHPITGSLILMKMESS
jgi:hypothetical protein